MKNIVEQIKHLTDEIIRRGYYANKTYEILGYSFTTEADLTPVKDYLSEDKYKFSISLAESIVEGDSYGDILKSKTELSERQKSFLPEINKETGISTMYGGKVKRQFNKVAHELSNYSYTRKAYISILGENDFLINESSEYRNVIEYPCTEGYLFRVVRGKLDIVVSMRSSNVKDLLIIDYVVAYKILEAMCVAINREMGNIIFNISSAHVFV